MSLVEHDGPPDVLFFIGHGPDAPSPSEPARVDLGLPCTCDPPTIQDCDCRFAWLDPANGRSATPERDFRRLFSGKRTRVALLHACNVTSRTAFPLLEGCSENDDQGPDHVVGLQTEVGAKLLDEFWGAFFQSLALCRPIGEAVRLARNALLTAAAKDQQRAQATGRASRPTEDWSWAAAHWSRTLDERAFADAATRAYDEFVEQQLDELVLPEREAPEPWLAGGAEPIRLGIDPNSPLQAEKNEPVDDWNSKGLRGASVSLQALLEDEVTSELAPTTSRLRPRLYVTLRGKPGSGKSTTLRHYAVQRLRSDRQGTLPLFVRLTTWHRWLGAGEANANSLGEFVTRSLSADHAGLVRTRIDQANGEKALLILLDGLDEAVAREGGRDAVRNLVSHIG
ncbi:MAG: hypothetical protein AAF368_12640, partial [Planctomycetota bacterium]